MTLEMTNTIAPGELAMGGVEDSARTGYNAETTDTIAPGLFVAIAAGKEGNLERRGLIVPAASTAIVVGISKKDPLNPLGSKPKGQVAYFMRGRIGLTAFTAIKAGDQIYCGISGANKGKASNAAGTGATEAIIVNGCRSLSTITAAGTIIVELNIP